MKAIHTPRPAARIAVSCLLALIAVLTTSLLFSQARLVTDINTYEFRHYNEYSQLTLMQNAFFFVSQGKELWKSDGTPSGTSLLKSLRAIQNLTTIGSTLYFAGKDNDGLELWKSDGTVSGTLRVKDIRSGAYGSTPKLFTGLGETVFFVANDGRGEELWRTDGTSAGTAMVKEIRTGAGGSKPLYLTPMNNVLYFSANDGKHGRELWRSDGTPGETRIVKDIQSRPGRSGEPQELTALNGALYFSAIDASAGRELWKSDGTPHGTTQLKDINPGSASAGIVSIRLMGNAIYFNANNGTTGTALWRSNGTTSGTYMVKDLRSDSSEPAVDDMTVLDNRIYWLLGQGEVWVSNGTASGTRVAATFENRDTPAHFTWLNNKIYFFAAYWSDDPYGPIQQLCSMNPDGSAWREVWKMERPFTVGGEEDEFYYAYSLDMIALNEALFFPGTGSDSEGYKLLRTNGTDVTVLFDTYIPTQSSYPNTMLRNDYGVFFQTQSYPWEDEMLWRTDGTDSGTTRVETQSIGNIVTIDNQLFYSTRSPTGNWQLRTSDGTPESSIVLQEIPGINYEVQGMLVDIDATLFFYNLLGQLWTSDGTPTGTLLLKTFSGIENVVGSGDIAYIMVRSASGGQELWKSNGTPEGTIRVKTIRSGDGPSTSNYMTTATLGNVFYFVGNDGQHGREVWRTDGTEGGTFMLKDLRINDNEPTINDIWRLISFNNAIYINAADEGGEMSLFRTDGTSAGTHEIYDSHRITEFMPLNDHLLFVSTDNRGQQLYATDGTTTGTTLLQDLPHNSGWWITHAEINGALYFGFQNSELLWRTDGTVCGTKGIRVGVKKIDNLIAAGGDLLLFSGHHPAYGEEVFSVRVNRLSAPLCPQGSSVSRHTSAEMNPDEGEAIFYSPNPFDRDLTINITSPNESPAQVSIYDLSGHPVSSGMITTNQPYQLGNEWKEGIYIMRIVVDGTISTRKIVKRPR